MPERFDATLWSDTSSEHISRQCEDLGGTPRAVCARDAPHEIALFSVPVCIGSLSVSDPLGVLFSSCQTSSLIHMSLCKGRG